MSIESTREAITRYLNSNHSDLSMMAPESRVQSLAELHRHFEAQPERFRTRFAPALHGLDGQGDGRTFLGWAAKAHWLMPDESKRG